jgi:TetR/AcrR family transcriptional regulator, cholesterol catabolism regulator
MGGRLSKDVGAGASPAPAKQATGVNASGSGQTESTRQRVLDAAAGLFLKYGYEGTTMNRLAKEVGVSAPALYWHFASKAELALAFMQRSLESVGSYVDSAVSADDPVERLNQFVRAYVTYELELGKSLPAEDTLHRHGFEELLDSLTEGDRMLLKRLRRRLFDLLSEILEAGVGAGVFHLEDRAVTAQAIITMCDYLFTWYRPGGRFSVATIADIYAVLASRMVGDPAAVKGAT